MEMTPTFCEIEMGTSRERKLGLLDSCAQLSLIGRDTLKELQQQETVTLYEQNLKIKGIGSSEAHHFCQLPVTIKTSSATIRMEAEFWVVDSLNESFVLGMDFITKYGIDLHISERRANMRHKGKPESFPLYFGREWREEMIRSEYCVRSRKTITIAPRTEGTVEVAITGQDRQLRAQDLFLEPVITSNLQLSTFGCAAKGIVSLNTSLIWYANMGDQPLTITRGMKLGTATHLEGDASIMVTEAIHSTGDRLDKGNKKHRKGGIKAETLGIPTAYTAMQMSEVDILGKQPAEGIGTEKDGIMVPPDPNDLPPPAAEPQRYDGFDISTQYGHNGAPPRQIVDTLREFGEAFTDGLPGRVKDGTEMHLDTIDDEKLTPQPLRHQGPRKREAIDKAIDQLLEWGIIEPSESKVSYFIYLLIY